MAHNRTSDYDRIRAEKGELVRDLDTLRGQIRMDYDYLDRPIGKPTSRQREQARVLGEKIAACDTALNALLKVRD